MSGRRITAYKMTRPDGRDFRSGTVEYKVGAVIEVPDATADGNECGPGLHVCPTAHGPLAYNATYPWRLWEVSYVRADILHETKAKTRVRRLRVDRELGAFDLPHVPGAKGIGEVLERWRRVRFLPRTLAREEAVTAILHRYAAALSAADQHRRQVVVSRVRFYSVRKWGSVQDSVWGSVWGSVRGSVNNPFLGELEIMEQGAVLYGIDKVGVAHVIMPDEEEVVG